MPINKPNRLDLQQTHQLFPSFYFSFFFFEKSDKKGKKKEKIPGKFYLHLEDKFRYISNQSTKQSIKQDTKQNKTKTRLVIFQLVWSASSCSYNLRLALQWVTTTNHSLLLFFCLFCFDFRLITVATINENRQIFNLTSITNLLPISKLKWFFKLVECSDS